MIIWDNLKIRNNNVTYSLVPDILGGQLWLELKKGDSLGNLSLNTVFPAYISCAHYFTATNDKNTFFASNGNIFNTSAIFKRTVQLDNIDITATDTDHTKLCVINNNTLTTKAPVTHDAAAVFNALVTVNGLTTFSKKVTGADSQWDDMTAQTLTTQGAITGANLGRPTIKPTLWVDADNSTTKVCLIGAPYTAATTYRIKFLGTWYGPFQLNQVNDINLSFRGGDVVLEIKNMATGTADSVTVNVPDPLGGLDGVFIPLSDDILTILANKLISTTNNNFEVIACGDRMGAVVSNWSEWLDLTRLSVFAWGKQHGYKNWVGVGPNTNGSIDKSGATIPHNSGDVIVFTKNDL